MIAQHNSKPGFGGAFSALYWPLPWRPLRWRARRAWLARINQALKAMPPMSGRFEQKLPNGGHAAGSMQSIGRADCALLMMATAAL